ncbi:hypothetical protein RA180_12995 [Aeromonas salmonicida]|uniref:hypothetical protein n=1 Tax=Aeromonas salmonicida TaxID=645 RepID=UPI002796E179|nr:hypothetical protein [Aeromonas salmonicida]MDQ1884909.1 hypothetical protein [Aeromonas salmonicida]
MKKTFTALLGITLLQGCATPLDDSQYTGLALGLASTKSCVRDGYMTTAVGALGQEYTYLALSKREYDKQIWESRLAEAEKTAKPTQAECSEAEMDIIMMQNKLNAATAQRQHDETLKAIKDASNKKTYTNCTTIGVTTSCNSF